MRKTFLAAAVAALVAAAPAAAERSKGLTLTGGATKQGRTITLVSNTGDASATNDFSTIELSTRGVTTFSSLRALRARLNTTDDGCAGGAPRFSVTFTGGKTLHVYIGQLVNGDFICPLNTWFSTGNVLRSTDARFDLTQFGGPFYGTYAQALALVGTQTVESMRLAVDAGWKFADKEQTVLVRASSVKVKGTKTKTRDDDDDDDDDKGDKKRDGDKKPKKDKDKDDD
jgi:hypothetical protein